MTTSNIAAPERLLSPPGKAAVRLALAVDATFTGLNGAIYRYRTGVAWRDLPASFGPWQTVWKRHHRFSTDGTWDKVLAALQVQA
ncbi:MAG: transposase, partial [Geodermatophilaceae bacterium]